jgi:Tfp pilus assembly protein PilX
MVQKSHSPLASKQRGTALIFSLVILAIMTMLAVTGMGTSNLQFLMAGNMQQQTLALIKAENTIFTAADYAATSINSQASASPTSAGNGYFIYNDTTKLTGAEALYSSPTSFWSNSSNYRTGSDSNEKYVIEYLANRPPTDSSLSIGALSSSPSRNIYRVTARGISDKGATRTLQSIVVTEQKPL